MTQVNSDAAVQKGLVLIEQGRYKEAMGMFKDVLSQDPTDDLLLYYLALAQYHLDGYQKESLRTIDSALMYETQEPSYFQLKALILAGLRQYKKGLESANEALRLDAEYAPAFGAKAYIYTAMEKWTDAEKSAKDALAIDGDNPFAGNILANALRMQNKLDESVMLTSDLLAKDPDNSLSHSNAGWVYLNRKNYSKAQEHFKESLRLDPNFEPARSGMLEAYKAKSPVYRMYLNYGLFMTRQSKTKRFIIIFGIYIFFQVVIKNFNELFQGPMVLLGYALVFMFFLFFFWSWLSGGVGNLLVLSDKSARFALNKREILDGVFVGGGFILGVCLIVFTPGIPMKILGLSLILSAIPSALTFTNHHKMGQIFYGSIAGCILLAGIANAIGFHLYGKGIPESLKIVMGLALVLFAITTWLGVFGFLRKA